MTGHYKRSKFLAEQVALEFAGAGLPVVIVNPTAPVGDHDFKPTPTGKIIVDFLRGAMPAFVDTGLNVVDAEDTAEGHILRFRERQPRRTVYPRRTKHDASELFSSILRVSAGIRERRKFGPLYAGLRCRGYQHRFRLCYRKRTASAARWRPHGPKEDVGFVR